MIPQERVQVPTPPASATSKQNHLAPDWAYYRPLQEPGYKGSNK